MCARLTLINETSVTRYNAHNNADVDFDRNHGDSSGGIPTVQLYDGNFRNTKMTCNALSDMELYRAIDCCSLDMRTCDGRIRGILHSNESSVMGCVNGRYYLGDSYQL
jgi:hypothetical protein